MRSIAVLVVLLVGVQGADVPKMTAVDFAQQWKDNQAKVKQDYEGKQVVLTGVVKHVKKNSAALNYHMNFASASGRTTLYYPECYFDDPTVITNLKAGQEVTITGTVAVIGGNQLVVRNCKPLK